MNETTVLDADEAFFAALLAADTQALDDVLAEDFTLIDVMAGQLVRATCSWAWLPQGSWSSWR